MIGRGRRRPLDPTRRDLVVVAESFDDAEACSTVLARAEDAGWVAAGDALLRHHLVLPAAAVDAAVALAAQDGYVLGDAAGYVLGDAAGYVLGDADGDVTGDAAREAAPSAVAPNVRAVVLQRVQVLDALHCAQEKSRMAGLAQRHGGTARGWDALQVPAEPGPTTD
nr:hypothetical protein [Rhodococcus sp. HNM0569]